MSTTPLKKVPDPAPAAADMAKATKLAAGVEPNPDHAEPAAKAQTVKPAEADPKAQAVKPAPVANAKPKAQAANAVSAEATKATAVKPVPVTEAKPNAAKSAPVAAPKADVTDHPLLPERSPTPSPGDPQAVLTPAQHARATAAAVRTLRRARARRLGSRVALGVGLPTLLATIYFFLIASSQYESVSLFTVQSAEGRAGIGIETLLGAVPGVSSARDTLAVRDFITSRDMLDVLQRKLALSKHYGDPASDWWARLPSDAMSEDVYDYYREVVQVDHDSNSGVLTLRVRAFSPDFAKKISDAVLSESEKMVNQLSERARLDQTKVARGEVLNAEERLTKARQAIVTLQRDHAEFNPEMTATEAFTLRGSLKVELAKARAELMEARSFMQPGAPRVVALEERARSLSAQVSEESQRLVNPKGDKGLGNRMAEFEAAMVEKEFAQGAYQSALASLELARTEAARQHRYLATIAKPSMPNDETHPKRIRGVITVVLLSAMGLGMVMLLVEAVREHARI